MATPQNNPVYKFLKKNSALIMALLILGVLAAGLFVLQFRHPLALNMDGGNNAANVQALMNFQKMPFSGSPILPFFLSAICGFLFGSVHAGIKIVVTLALVMVGWLIYDFLRKVTKDDIPAIAGLLGWCVSLGVFWYPLGYLKQTVALPILFFGLISLYWFMEKKNPKKSFIFWMLSLVGVLLSHSPSFIIFLACSFLITAIMLPGSDLKNGKIISWIMWGLMGLGVITTPWTVPILSKYYVQLSLNGWKTMITSIKGLFSHRYQMQVDFNFLDYLHVAVPVFGLIWSYKKWKRLTLWFVGFGFAIFIVALFLCEYEWQERNILTMFVPMSMLVGIGFYHLARLISDKKIIYVSLAVVMAFAVFGVTNYPNTIVKTIKLARPVVTVPELVDLNNFLETEALEFTDNLYARHGLRFWVTYATEKHCGVLYRHWTDNFLAVRKSRGEVALPEGKAPEKGDYILLSKTALFEWKKTEIRGRNFRVFIPTRAQEYLNLEFIAADDFPSVEVILKSEKSDEVFSHTFHGVPIGSNDLGWLLADVPRDKYNVRLKIGDDLTKSAPLYIEENLLDWADSEFSIITQSDEYLVMEVK